MTVKTHVFRLIYMSTCHFLAPYIQLIYHHNNDILKVSSSICCGLLKVFIESLTTLEQWRVSLLGFGQIRGLNGPARAGWSLYWPGCSGFCPGMAPGYLWGPSTPAAISVSQTAVSEYSYKVQINVCLFGLTWCAVKQAKVCVELPKEVVGVKELQCVHMYNRKLPQSVDLRPASE